MDRKTHIMSIGKAFTLMNCLAKETDPLTLRELSERTGYPKSTIHSILSTMREYRAIVQNNDGRYRLGSALFELGRAVQKQWDITKIARPYLQSICTKLNETTGIGILDGDSVLVLDSVFASNPLRIITDVGLRMPIHASAPGKAILAHMSEEEFNCIFKHTDMAVYTPQTISDIGELRKECAKTIEDGYAIENGELRIGMRAVAAPIFDIDGKAKYAISVVGMFRRITDDDFIKAQKLVVNAAHEITEKMH